MIKIINGEKVTEFRIPKENTKVNSVNNSEEEFEFDVLTSKWSKIILVAIIILAAIFMLTPSKSIDDELGNKIGNYTYTHKLPTGEPVYRMVTPRGHEWVVGRDNLELSLEIYAEAGVEGEDFRQVKESEIFPGLVKSLDLIEMEIKLEEKRIKEFDKEFLNEEK